MLRVDFQDIYKISTQNSIRHSKKSSTAETLSMGIMDSLLLSESMSSEQSVSFDDAERRKKARSTSKHRELEVGPLQAMKLRITLDS